ncbi:MAG: 2-phospho-L-lactate guanylyltransferase [Halobacteriota archaeon]
MRVVVPFEATHPKTRLSPPLEADERRPFAEAMLEDVLEAIRGAGGDPTVLSTVPIEVDAPVEVDTRRLTPAVNAALEATDEPVAIVMADLALTTPRTLERLFGATGDVVVAPGRGGGTNALVVRHPDFRVDYHGASYLDHLRIAREVGASVRELDSHRLSTDIDEPSDLAELLILSDGAARDWLVDAGFALDIDEGRVGVRRTVE